MKKNNRKLGIVSIFSGIICTLAVSAYSPLFMYFQNAGEAHFRDISFVLPVFIVTGLVLFGLFLLITRNAAKAGLVASIFLLVFLNYAPVESLIQRLFPNLRYWHIAPIFLVLLIQFGWFIWRKVPNDLCIIITPVLGAVFGALILINGLIAIPSITTRLKAERQAARKATETIVSVDPMPNFYFLLFDEFSTIPFMQKYYNYDNSKLLTALEGLGFNVSQTGHNSSNLTAVVTANILHLDYKAVWHGSEEALFAFRADNPVFSILREAGYEIVSPAGSDYYGLPNAIDDNTFSTATTLDGSDIRAILIRRSVIYPFLHDTSNYNAPAKKILDQLSFIKNPDNFKPSNQFVLAHYNLPHEPFYFNSDGSMSSTPSSDWDRPEPYLNQYRFTSDQIISIAEHLVSEDPKAMIWIMSDHSARAASNNELYLKKFSMEDMTNFFNVVYFEGKTINIEGLSAVNTMRLLLNELLGTSYEAIPLPEEDART